MSGTYRPPFGLRFAGVEYRLRGIHRRPAAANDPDWDKMKSRSRVECDP